MISQNPEIIIIKGPVNSGKSKIMEKLADSEKKNGSLVSGIIARGVFEQDSKIGFDLINISSETTQPLARISNPDDEFFPVGKYNFSKDGFLFAKEALLDFHNGGVVFLDEVGPLELEGGGYADCLITLLNSDISRLYIAVRDSCLETVVEEFLDKRNYRIIKVEKQAESE